MMRGTRKVYPHKKLFYFRNAVASDPKSLPNTKREFRDCLLGYGLLKLHLNSIGGAIEHDHGRLSTRSAALPYKVRRVVHRHTVVAATLGFDLVQTCYKPITVWPAVPHDGFGTRNLVATNPDCPTRRQTLA